MSAVDAEDVRTALQAALKSDEFSSRLSALYTAKGDADNFRALAEVYRASKFAPQVFPSGEIGLDRGVGGTASSKAHDVTYEVTLYWHVDGSEEERLEDELSRLVATTHDFFASRPHLLPYLASCSVWTGDEDYSPVTRLDEGYIKSAAVAVFVRTIR